MPMAGSPVGEGPADVLLEALARLTAQEAGPDEARKSSGSQISPAQGPGRPVLANCSSIAVPTAASQASMNSVAGMSSPSGPETQTSLFLTLPPAPAGHSPPLGLAAALQRIPDLKTTTPMGDPHIQCNLATLEHAPGAECAARHLQEGFGSVVRRATQDEGSTGEPVGEGATGNLTPGMRGSSVSDTGNGAGQVCFRCCVICVNWGTVPAMFRDPAQALSCVIEATVM